MEHVNAVSGHQVFSLIQYLLAGGQKPEWAFERLLGNECQAITWRLNSSVICSLNRGPCSSASCAKRIHVECG